MGRDRVFIEENLLYLQLSQNGQSTPVKSSPTPPTAPPWLTALAYLRPTEPSERFQRLQQAMDRWIFAKNNVNIDLQTAHASLVSDSPRAACAGDCHL